MTDIAGGGQTPNRSSNGSTKRVLLLVNTSARNGAATYSEAETRLKELGFAVLSNPDAKIDQFGKLITKHKGSVDLVVLGGGDGTVSAGLNALVETKIPFGIIPLGTANNLARSLGIDPDLDSALKVIEAGNSRQIDLASVNDHYFLNVAGLGLSTQVNRHVPSDLKRRFGVLAYIWYAFKIVRRFKPFSVRIRTEDFDRVVRTMQITVCNGRHYGSGLVIAHDASIDDGRLDLCSTEIQHWWQGFKLIPAFLRGRYDGRQEIRLVQGEEIRLDTRRTFKIDVDGEIVTQTPAVFKVMPQALEVLAPPPVLEEQLAIEEKNKKAGTHVDRLVVAE